MKAFVLLNTELGQEASIIESLEGVKEIVFNRIRRLEHVKSTITLLTYGEPIINE